MSHARQRAVYTDLVYPFSVEGVRACLAVEDGEVKVFVAQEAGAEQHCPKCGLACPGYDRRRQSSWRHLDTCQFKTILMADMPRIKCPEHGVVTVGVLWSEPGSGFTVLFEALVIDWLKEASLAAVSRQLGLERVVYSDVITGAATGWWEPGTFRTANLSRLIWIVGKDSEPTWLLFLIV
jgi:transposase